ncbi:MazG family protein [Allobranchiibius sp. CTAmp26]|uniref:MazG family protein n=1 Tax=Allobranchiibius sp. CTAmp26 TaxID=2815214 RepID=UPI0027DBEF30|nr:MazG family protein [Allobranchiibius sp. CTAmp26]
MDRRQEHEQELSATNTGEASLAILVTSPRVPAGLLSRSAWQVLEAADVVYAADLDEPVPDAVATSGVQVRAAAYGDRRQLARALAQHDGRVVWIGSADGDPGLTDALAGELTRLETPPAVEIVVGSWDLPGARLLDAVAVMDTLRSPGGCPWDAEQTHDSLAKYLVEEAYETLEAIELRDRGHLAEELGDVLLQVLFHARLAAEDQQEPFDIDDVAGGLVAKLIRRHPHVFSDGDATTPGEVEASWEQIKAAEKPDRDADDLLAGVPKGLPTLLVAEKLLSRAARRGVDLAYDDSTGSQLLRQVAAARERGESAETVLGRELRAVAARSRKPSAPEQ